MSTAASSPKMLREQGPRLFADAFGGFGMMTTIITITTRYRGASG